MGRAGPRRDPATGPTARDDHPPHRVRHQLLSHATDFMARDPAPAPFARNGLYRTRSGDRRYRTRRSSRVRRCPEMSGYARLCPVMPGRWSVIPGDVSLPGLSGDCFTGCERPNYKVGSDASLHPHVQEPLHDVKDLLYMQTYFRIVERPSV